MTKRYSESFKSNVVQKVRDGKTPKEAAAECGASTFAVRDWLKAADEAASSRAMTPQEHAEIKRLRKEVSDLKEERDILKKSHGVLCAEPDVKYAFIEQHRAEHPLRLLCRLFGLSRSNHYAYCKRVQRRAAVEAPIVEAMKAIHKERFKKHYGSPRMTAELKVRGFAINRKRVGRLMRKEGLIVAKKRRLWKTTDSNHPSAIAPNVLERDFAIGQINHRWAADITYLWTPQEVIYLAIVIDLGSRKLVGYAVANHMRTSLCLEALEMALCHEGKSPSLAHTDRGSQYASEAYRSALQERGITLSMSAKGDCWDNAVSESFFGTLKTELGDHFLSLQDAQRELFDYWLFYNKNRLHSTLGFVSPENYINNIGAQQKLAA